MNPRAHRATSSRRVRGGVATRGIWMILAVTSIACRGAPLRPQPNSQKAAISARTAPMVVPEATKACPNADAPKALTTLHIPEIDEASGIIASRQNAGVYWIHNDSGDTARAFAVTTTGEIRAVVAFDAAMPIDIEDMATEDLPDGRAYLYFADIGDNTFSRKAVTIHRVVEPNLSQNVGNRITVTSEKMSVVYPDGAHNAETLLFDPATKELLIATKVKGGPSDVHRVGPFVPNRSVTTTKIATIQIPLATGGDISRDGRFIAVRNYTEWAFLWERRSGEPLASALQKEPCKIPVSPEKQGEAFAFLADGKGYVTTSEGTDQDIRISSFH